MLCTLIIKQDLGGGLNKIGMNLLGVEDLGLKVSWASVVPRCDLILNAYPVGHRGFY